MYTCKYYKPIAFTINREKNATSKMCREVWGGVKQMARGWSQIPVAQCTQRWEIDIEIHFESAMYHRQCFPGVELLFRCTFLHVPDAIMNTWI